MHKLILVKHSAPEIVAGMPANQWRLSEQGLSRCALLAERLRAYAPSCLAASVEPKATQTAELVARALGVDFGIVPGLHEHERDNAGFLGAEEFHAAVKCFFERPEQLVFGRETAEEAHRRFAQAVEGVVANCRERTVAIVAHGTVISLFVACAAGIDPFALWQRLDLPSFVVLSLPDLGILEVVETVER